jgi:predicted NBD/HSP70 family sugar kinase
MSQQIVFQTILHQGPISRADVARRTGLSRPTVSSVVAGLVTAGLITESGRRTGTPGRNAILYRVHPEARYVVGVDLGGTNVRAAVADLSGDLLSEIRAPTDRYGGKRVLTQIAALAKRAAEEGGADWSKVTAMGLATPGVANPATGRLRLAPNVPGLHRTNLQRGLAAELEIPVLLENDVNLAAVGERWHGLAKNVSTFIFIAVGTGVGMGIIVNGELFTGAHGAAGEIAYLPLTADPFEGRHHAHGAFEDETGAAAIVEAAGRDPGWTREPPRSAEDVFSLARSGDPSARRIVQEEARRLAVGIAAVCAVIDPELVVMGGGVGRNPLLVDEIRAAVGGLLPDPPRIEQTRLGDKAAIHGAVASALRHMREGLFPPVPFPAPRHAEAAGPAGSIRRAT